MTQKIRRGSVFWSLDVASLSVFVTCAPTLPLPALLSLPSLWHSSSDCSSTTELLSPQHARAPLPSAASARLSSSRGLPCSPGSHYTTLFSALHYTALHCTLHSTLHCTALYTTLYTILHWTIHYSIQYTLHTTLYTAPHCSTLQNTLRCTRYTIVDWRWRREPEPERLFPAPFVLGFTK